MQARLVATGFVTLAALAACASNTAGSGGTIPATIEPQPSSPTTSPPALSLKQIATLTTSTDTGEKATIKISAGSPVPPSQADPAIVSCIQNFLTQESESRTRAIPVEYDVQFQSSLPGTYRLFLQGVSAEYVLTSPSFRCRTSPALIASPSNVAPGTTTSYLVWFVAQNVITPAKPAGDWQNSGVNQAVEPQFYVGPSNYVGGTTTSGPHVCAPNSYSSYMWLVEKPEVCTQAGV